LLGSSSRELLPLPLNLATPPLNHYSPQLICPEGFNFQKGLFAPVAPQQHVSICTFVPVTRVKRVPVRSDSSLLPSLTVFLLFFRVRVFAQQRILTELPAVRLAVLVEERHELRVIDHSVSIGVG
jgi:hypothetical protein